MDVGRDHLIHRKRSPFPYEGKALTPPKMGETANVGRTFSRSAKGSESAGHLIHRKRSPFPSIGEGFNTLELERDFECRA